MNKYFLFVKKAAFFTIFVFLFLGIFSYKNIYAEEIDTLTTDEVFLIQSDLTTLQFYSLKRISIPAIPMFWYECQRQCMKDSLPVLKIIL